MPSMPWNFSDYNPRRAVNPGNFPPGQNVLRGMPKLWPLARLTSVALTLALWARFALGWSPPSSAAIAAAALGLLKLFLLCLILSPWLARLLLVALGLPVYAMVMLNSLLYGISVWLARRLGDPARPRATAALALLFEVILVLGLANLLARA